MLIAINGIRSAPISKRKICMSVFDKVHLGDALGNMGYSEFSGLPEERTSLLKKKYLV